MRAMALVPPNEAAMRTISVADDERPQVHVSFVAADRDQDVRRVDAVAGSEFVDDRIRLQE